MRVASFAVGLLLAAIPALGRRTHAGEYVASEHPAGELRLRLQRDGVFVLRLAVWDPVVRSFVAEREHIGRWRCTVHGIELRTSTRRIRYTRFDSPTRGWKWERSNLPTFADGISLYCVLGTAYWT